MRSNKKHSHKLMPENVFYVLRHDRKMLLITIGLLILVVIASVLFSHSYSQLNQSIQNERVEAVGQIGTIILEKVQLLSESYTSELEQSAGLLVASKVDSLEQAKLVLNDAEDTYILKENGTCCDLSGNTVTILNTQAVFQSLSADTPNTLFSVVNEKGDFWVFSTPITGISIDGEPVAGLLKLIDAKVYADITTNMIFGNQGAGYVVGTDGIILLRPGDPESGPYLQSFNILNIMAEESVPEKDIAVIRTALEELTQAQIVTNMQKTTWLIQTVPDADGRSIVLTVPISITAKDTFSNMRFSIAAMIILIIGLSLLFILWIYHFFRRNGQIRLEQEKAIAKSDFMSKMSHDIRTPLNAIVGMIEIAYRSIGNKEAVRGYLESAQGSCKYLIDIISDVLDMNRIESGKMRINHAPFNLKTLLNSVVQIEAFPAQTKGLQLILEDQTPDDVAYEGDAIRIKQCLVNLLSNAVKFTPSGGTVTLRCEEQRINKVQRRVCFSVQDTGVGMSQAFMKTMFNPFEQEYNSTLHSEVSGSGLGLAIVYNLTKLMSGTIYAESQKGEGSRFVMELPLDTVAREEPLAQSNKGKGTSLKNKRVLLAEDNAINRSIATFLLQDFGLLVDEAENGALAVARFTASPPGFYDCILMDIQMPVMDGLEAARRIRADSHPDAATIPIIALSANAFGEDSEKSHAAGMQAHLSKPIDPDLLKSTLITFLCENGNEDRTSS